jgi:hypothetical protein
MVSRLEALVDAIGKLNGMDDPESRAYQLRNPLLLKALSLTRLQAQDEGGVRQFESLLGGYRAGLNDLHLKCAGLSRAKLNGKNSLEDLLGSLDIQHAIAVKRVVGFVQRAVKDGITEHEVWAGTRLQWFLEDFTKIEKMPGEKIAEKVS